MMTTFAKTWFIYSDCSGRVNLERALEKGVWGAKDLRKVDGVQQGDQIILVHCLHLANTANPRVKLDEFVRAVRGAQITVTGEVVSAVFEDTTPIWDDETYEHRFRFEARRVEQNVDIISKYTSEALDAIRHSMIQAGKAYPVAGPVTSMSPNEEPPTSRRYWVEKTLVRGRPDRESGPHALGQALWSPQRAANGQDFYRRMRDIQPDDVVIHLVDNQRIAGVSIAAAPTTDTLVGLPGTDWAGRAAYRVSLRDYTELDPAIDRAEFLAAPQYRETLLEILARNEGLFYNRHLNLNQGAYLTEAPVEFVQLLDGLYSQKTGRSLPHLDSLSPPLPSRRYWAVAAGEGGRLWSDFQQQGLVAIGWDYLGDLRQYPDKDTIAEAIQRERNDDRTPTNDALACYQFLHEMKPGDIIFVKKGQEELLGMGEIVSEYMFDPDRSEYHHTRRVTWTKNGSWVLDKDRRVAQKTLTDLTRLPGYVAYLLQLFTRDETPPPTVPDTIYTIEMALSDVFLDRSEFETILNVLARKKNLILAGPPGVGKTFVARRIAFALLGQQDASRIGMVQFHQSYAYEDFMQGWRPTKVGGFERKDGVFYDFCGTAQGDPDRSYVFIIDEINRGNLSKIFGELMLLLEADKRGPDYAIPLTYAEDHDDRFYIPNNVYVLGMMNTADRSLAMVDYALRRRFGFVELSPAFAKPKFRDHLIGAGVPEGLVTRIIERMGTLNARIVSDKDLGRGFAIGHSFFVPIGTEEELDEDWYNLIVRSEIEPLLHEYWFDTPDKVAELTDEL